MALNRYLYPQKGTNIVQQVALTTRVNIDSTNGDVTGIVAGRGLTVVHNGLGVYAVTFDNSSSVSQVIDATATVTATPYAAANHILLAPTSVSTTGATFQSFQPNTGAVGFINVAGAQLSITLICTLSAVPA